MSPPRELPTPPPLPLGARLRASFAHVPRTVGLVWRASRKGTIALGFLTVAASLLPLAVAAVAKLIVDAVLAHRGDLALRWIVLEAALVALQAGAMRGLGLVRSVLGARLGLDINVEILEKALTLELSHFEDPEVYDRLTRARREASARPISVVLDTFQIVQNAVTLAGYVVLIASYSGWVVLGLVAATIPATVAEMKFGAAAFRLRNWRSPDARRLNYLEHVLANDEYAKEVKIFGFGRLLLDRYKELGETFYREDTQLAVRRSAWAYGLSLLATGAFYASYVAMGVAAAAAAITLGQMTLYVLAFRQGQQAFQSILGAVGGMYEDNLYMSNLFEFLAMKVEGPRPSPALSAPDTAPDTASPKASLSELGAAPAKASPAPIGVHVETGTLAAKSSLASTRPLGAKAAPGATADLATADALAGNGPIGAKAAPGATGALVIPDALAGNGPPGARDALDATGALVIPDALAGNAPLGAKAAPGATGTLVIPDALAGNGPPGARDALDATGDLATNGALAGNGPLGADSHVDAGGPLARTGALARGIVFEDVGFLYPGRDTWALRHIDLELPLGRSVALVGHNGAGKTTFIKLLTRLYEPTEGRILLDGKDLRDHDPAEVRRRIGVVFQNFGQYKLQARETVGIGSVARMGDDSLIERAVELGGATEVVDRLPQKLDTQLGRWFKGGVELSGGQWQKLALARAFMREDADILILDEPTASLDAEAEHAVFERFQRLAKGKTSIVISHRFPTVRLAERIVVLEKGHIVEQGTHTALLDQKGLYARLFTLQAQGYT
ncbi:MAG: ABC transporter ATP-binding protein/permease [Polyangiaceae bacterium]